MVNNHNIALERNPIFEVSSSLHPPFILPSSSYRPPINPVSIPY